MGLVQGGPESLARDQRVSVVWTFTYWLFLESFDISVVLFDLLGKQTRALCSKAGCSKRGGNIPEV